MYPTKFLTVLSLAIVTCTAVSAAYADLPGDRTIEFRLRETPTDPQSAVVFVVQVDLAAVGSDGHLVGWEIKTARFRQPDSELGDLVWVADSPTVRSRDGLWWIEHDDPANPQLEEFTLLPLLIGTATATDPLQADLDYDVQGVAYVPQPGEELYEVTAALDHVFHVVGDPEPEEECEDEPVEADFDDDPPNGS